MMRLLGRGMRTGSARRRSERGMTLVEVIVALGILAGVLVSVASLFVLGGAHVKHGAQVTEGSTIASDVLEELVNLNRSAVVDVFPSCAAATTGCTVSSLTDAFASAQWQSLIDQSLYQGSADIILTPIGGTVAPPTFASCEGVRINVRISWSEGTNVRSVTMETLSF